MNRTVASCALLVSTLAVGIAVVRTDPAGSHTGTFWTAGLAVGVLVLTPARFRLLAVLALSAVAFAVFRISGYPPDVAAGYALTAGGEAFVAAGVLTARWTRPVHVVDNVDLGRFSAACVLGALVGAGGFAATAASASFGSPWRVFLAVLLGHTVALSVVVGLYAERDNESPNFSLGHRTLIWVCTGAVSAAAFIPGNAPVLAFLVIPVLGWMAFNGRFFESALQLLAVAAFAVTMNNAGFGPFEHPYLGSRFDGDFRDVPIHTFLLACALVSIPLSMSVRMLRSVEAEAIRERIRSARLVEGAYGIAIMEMDPRGVITSFNPGAQRILGYSASEVVGRATNIFQPEGRAVRITPDVSRPPQPGAFAEVMSAAATGQAYDIEFIRKDGARRVLSTVISPLVDEHGEVNGYVATADDVTERLEAQKALETALEAEREAVRRLTEVDQVKDRFVSSVSHELRTPLTNIVGYLELLMDGAYGAAHPQQAQALTRIEMNSRRLLALIDDLLTLSSMEVLGSRKAEPTDLVAVMTRAEEIVRPGTRDRDLRLEMELPDHPVMVLGDANQLDRLVINLATNAVKFTPTGRVTLRLLAGSDSTGPVIEVEDTGIGIPEADQEMLFSRFFRAAQAREAAVPGSGLGLSIAKSIAELHGAQISATSVSGKGSTFRVEFPVDDRR